jgi:hypothetical protein
MGSELSKVPLIVDPDKEFLRSLADDERALSIPPLLASDPVSAESLLEINSDGISCVLISPDIGCEAVTALLNKVFGTLFGVPIYFISSPSKSRTDTEARVFTTDQILDKPVTYGRILDWVGSKGVAKAKAREAAPTTPRKSAGVKPSDQDLATVKPNSLIRDSSMIFDIYVKLGENRYVCVVKAGEAIDSERIERYVSRGVQEFYFRKSDQEAYMKICEHLSSMLAPAS